MTGYSWLSICALDILDMLENKSQQRTVIHSFAQTIAWNENDKLLQPHIVIGKLIWQLIVKKPDIVEDLAVFEAIETRIKSDEWTQSNNSASPPREPCSLMTELLNHFPKTYRINCCLRPYRF
jgi:hypothetical protein